MQIEQWDVFEKVYIASREFNKPFHDVIINAVFYFQSFDNAKSRIKVNGFYDGKNRWIIRFMPDKIGTYYYKLKSNYIEFNGQEGNFECIQPSLGNHGPVVISKKYHFSFKDGSPFFVLGTTAYVWHHRSIEMRNQTLESFKKNNFNKIRMLFFPKHYVGDFNDVNISLEPPCYPFEGDPNNFDFRFPNPEYYRQLEECIREMKKHDIQADIILFHNYDYGHWGIPYAMTENDDIYYIKYLVSRLAAYRNVWFSLANEYNLFFYDDKVKSKLKTSYNGWNTIGDIVKYNDPYGRMISIHNHLYGPVYPNEKWMTHVSYQHPNTFSMLLDLKNKYGKPVINDEYQYEGNIQDEWGNTSGSQELFRHWQTAFAGGYATHGEAFIIDSNRVDVFWAYGGVLIGESAPRLKYLKNIIESCDFHKMKPDFTYSDGYNSYVLSDGKGYSLYLYRHFVPGKKMRYGFNDDSSSRYDITIYDIWNCLVVDRYVVGKNHDINIKDWTVIKIIKIK